MVRPRRGVGRRPRPGGAGGLPRAGGRRRGSGRPGSRPTPGSAPWSTPTPRPTGRRSRYAQAFGEEPVVVLARGDLQQLILTANIFRLLRLEGCLSGKVPKGAEPIPGPCAELAELDPVEFVSGPATFLNEAVVQIDRQLRRLAQHVPPERFRAFLLASPPATGSPAPPASTTPNSSPPSSSTSAAPAAPRSRASPTSFPTAARPRSSSG